MHPLREPGAGLPGVTPGSPGLPHAGRPTLRPDRPRGIRAQRASGGAARRPRAAGPRRREGGRLRARRGACGAGRPRRRRRQARRGDTRGGPFAAGGRHRCSRAAAQRSLPRSCRRDDPTRLFADPVHARVRRGARARGAARGPAGCGPPQGRHRHGPDRHLPRGRAAVRRPAPRLPASGSRGDHDAPQRSRTAGQPGDRRADRDVSRGLRRRRGDRRPRALATHRQQRAGAARRPGREPRAPGDHALRLGARARSSLRRRSAPGDVPGDRRRLSQARSGRHPAELRRHLHDAAREPDRDPPGRLRGRLPPRLLEPRQRPRARSARPGGRHRLHGSVPRRRHRHPGGCRRRRGRSARQPGRGADHGGRACRARRNDLLRDLLRHRTAGAAGVSGGPGEPIRRARGRSPDDGWRERS